jgi:hypothetical protein
MEKIETTKKDFWNLLREIALKVGNQKCVEQADENIDDLQKQAEKIARQRELLNNL